jgi:hypothetical protein
MLIDGSEFGNPNFCWFPIFKNNWDLFGNHQDLADTAIILGSHFMKNMNIVFDNSV